jgi:hypothetical protein
MLTDQEAEWLLGFSNDSRKMRAYIKQAKRDYDRRHRAKQPKILRRKRKGKAHRVEKRTGAHGYKFLKPAEVPRGKSMRAIIMSEPKPTTETFDDEVVPKLRFVIKLGNGEMQEWKIKPTMNSPSFRNLFNAFGEQESDWVGKRIKLKRIRLPSRFEHKYGVIAEPIK